MSYKKRGASTEAGIAQNRLQGIKQVEQTFDFGNGLNSTIYETLLNEVTTDIQTYNGLLTSADGLSTQIDNKEAKLKDLNTRLLNAIGSKYGYDSIEYEKAGGVRTSDYKRSSSKTNNNNTISAN
jgi:hypothetical protein